MGKKGRESEEGKVSEDREEGKWKVRVEGEGEGKREE